MKVEQGPDDIAVQSLVFHRALGRRLRRIRQEKGITARELCRRVSVDPSKMSRWETGGVRISLLMAVKLCRALEVSPNEMLDGVLVP